MGTHSHSCATLLPPTLFIGKCSISVMVPDDATAVLLYVSSLIGATADSSIVKLLSRTISNLHALLQLDSELLLG